LKAEKKQRIEVIANNEMKAKNGQFDCALLFVVVEFGWRSAVEVAVGGVD
jgi:hypothetical protein